MGYLLCFQVIEFYFILFLGRGAVLWFCYNPRVPSFFENFEEEKKKPLCFPYIVSYRLKWVLWFYENHQSRVHIRPTHACHFFLWKIETGTTTHEWLHKKTHLAKQNLGPVKNQKWQIIKCLFGNSSCQFYFILCYKNLKHFKKSRFCTRF